MRYAELCFSPQAAWVLKKVLGLKPAWPVCLSLLLNLSLRISTLEYFVVFLLTPAQNKVSTSFSLFNSNIANTKKNPPTQSLTRFFPGQKVTLYLIFFEAFGEAQEREETYIEHHSEIKTIISLLFFDFSVAAKLFVDVDRSRTVKKIR